MSPEVWTAGPYDQWKGFWASPGGGSVTRMNVGGYVCHLARPVAEEDLRRLLESFALPGRGHRRIPKGRVLGGRSAVWRHELPGVGAVVVKAYRRGGMLRVLRRRYYVRHGATRPEREVRNLLAARAAGLNVPEPVLGVSRGLVLYHGWLVTRLIAGRSLVEVVRSGSDGLPRVVDEVTRQVGLLVERRVAHVDLHPGNVFVGDDGVVYVLDFDRACAFAKPVEELRRQYEDRWRRAVEKHALPAVLADRFSEGLGRIAAREA